MSSKKRKRKSGGMWGFNFMKRNKSLKNQMHKYIYKKKDICCEDDYDRKSIIEQIFFKYTKICEYEGEQHEEVLNNINNDFGKMIGYLVVLKKNNDVEGIQLWHEVNKAMEPHSVNVVDRKSVELLFHEVPLYFLLSFLGIASLKLDFFLNRDAMQYERLD
jgi:hypothetical protein